MGMLLSGEDWEHGRRELAVDGFFGMSIRVLLRVVWI